MKHFQEILINLWHTSDKISNNYSADAPLAAVCCSFVFSGCSELLTSTPHLHKLSSTGVPVLKSVTHLCTSVQTCYLDTNCAVQFNIKVQCNKYQIWELIVIKTKKQLSTMCFMFLELNIKIWTIFVQQYKLVFSFAMVASAAVLPIHFINK